MIELSLVRHAFPDPHLYIDRKDGYGEYTFLHFFQSVHLIYEEKEIVTEPHSVIIFRPETMQYYKNDTPIIHDWFHFKGDVKSCFEGTSIEPDKLYYPSQTEFITSIVREMENEFFNARKNSREMLDLKFRELLINLDRAVSGEMSAQIDDKTNDIFGELRETMFTNLHEKWTVDKMAKETGFSTSRFYGIYKSIYGISPNADLINARIEAAKKMLLYEKKKVQDIAEILGYDNTTHFIRQFKQNTGYSPTLYIKKYQEEHYNEEREFDE